MAIIFAAGPSFAGFAGRQATYAYLLAAVLFVLGLLGLLKIIRLVIHGAIELLLALLILFLPWLANFSRGVHSRNFFVLVAVLMLAIWFMTDFRGVRDRAP